MELRSSGEEVELVGCVSRLLGSLSLEVLDATFICQALAVNCYIDANYASGIDARITKKEPEPTVVWLQQKRDVIGGR